MTKLTVTGPYTVKDQLKADVSNKFIGRGSASSSTAQYARDYGPMANTRSYTSEDVVFISAEGNRPGRIGINKAEIELAAECGVMFMTDGDLDRRRPYNIGEREVQRFLKTLKYEDNGTGIWTRKPVSTYSRRSFEQIAADKEALENGDQTQLDMIESRVMKSINDKDSYD